MPPRLSSVMSCKNASRPSGSSPAIGSSRMRYSGFVASTPAMATRRFSPPERPIGGWSWTFSNEKTTVSSALLFGGAQAAVLQAEGHVLFHGRLKELALRVLEHDADLAP